MREPSCIQLFALQRNPARALAEALVLLLAPPTDLRRFPADAEGRSWAAAASIDSGRVGVSAVLSISLGISTRAKLSIGL